MTTKKRKKKRRVCVSEREGERTRQTPSHGTANIRRAAQALTYAITHRWLCRRFSPPFVSLCSDGENGGGVEWVGE